MLTGKGGHVVVVMRWLGRALPDPPHDRDDPGPAARAGTGPSAPRRTVLKVGTVAFGGLVTASACGRQTIERPAVALDVLPVPRVDEEMTLVEALRSRRSVRAFTPEGLTPAELGQLLWAAQGVTHDEVRRTVPSAGALYPLEVYVVRPGEAWHYVPQGHRVERWSSSTAWPQLVAGTTSRDAIRGAPAALVIAVVADRTARKYGDEAARYVAMEAGHAAQNVLLQAVGLRLAAVPLGALDRNLVAAALAMSEDEAPYYVIPVGHPAEVG